MKLKIGIILLLVLFLASCYDKMVDDYYYGYFDNVRYFDFVPYNDSYEWNDMVYTPDDLDSFFLSVSKYMRYFVTYESDVVDYPKNPSETMWDGGGDCEDIALLFMNLVEVVSNGEVRMDLVLVEGLGTPRTIVDGGTPNHAQVMYKGVVYEAQSGWPIYNSVMYKYTFKEIFKR